MLKQAFAYIAGGNTNNGIVSRVIRSRPAKQFHADHALFQRIEVAGYRLIDDVLKKLAAAVASLEYITLNHFLQMMLQGRNVPFMLCKFRKLRDSGISCRG